MKYIEKRFSLDILQTIIENKVSNHESLYYKTDYKVWLRVGFEISEQIDSEMYYKMLWRNY